MCYENLNFLLLDLIEPLLCGRCGEMPKITADGLVSLLEVDCHGEANSNSRRMSEDVSQNFESFIYDCEGKNYFWEYKKCVKSFD